MGRRAPHRPSGNLAVEELREQHQLFKLAIRDEAVREIERDNKIAQVSETCEVEAYIAGFIPADFRSLARKDALSHFERTLDYADKDEPAEPAEPVVEA